MYDIIMGLYRKYGRIQIARAFARIVNMEEEGRGCVLWRQ